ncbi:MAG: glycosyltransferase family 4 protein [Pseudomonadota bacterium]
MSAFAATALADRPRSVVCIVGELPPPTGGMAVQAERLGGCLRSERHEVRHVPTNALRRQSPLRRVKGLRGVFNLALFLGLLVARMPGARVVHIFSNSYLSFWLFTVPAVLLGRLLGKRVVIHYHGGAADAFLQRQRMLVLPVLKAAHALLVPSSFLVEVFRRHGLVADELPNIMPLERFAFRLRERLVPRVLMARHLQPVYNPACGIRAFAQLAGTHPEARLTVAGDGPERARLDRLCAELGIADRVRFTGNVDNERMRAELQSHDLLLNSSRVDNQPVSLLEAFACGLPVVSTAVGGIPHMADDGREALLAPDDDPQALAEQMRRLVDDPALARRIVEAAHERVQAHDWSRIYPRLLQAYREEVPA